MRILLLAVALAAGIAVGATVPAVSGFVRNTLSAAGVPPTLFAFTAGPEATSPAAKADHAAGDGHAHAEPAQAAEGHAHGEHAHSEAEGEELSLIHI